MRLVGTLACVLAVGCASQGPPVPSGGDAAPGSTSPPSLRSGESASPTSAATPGRDGTRIIAADSDFGTMLYDGSGQPIYLFTAESGDRPACYGACAQDWPPVLTKGAPRVSGGVRSGLLGTTRRADGGTQVTYAGHPLYFYAHEDKYQVLCHDVEEYGGTWLVVRPDGTAAPG